MTQFVETPPDLPLVTFTADINRIEVHSAGGEPLIEPRILHKQNLLGAADLADYLAQLVCSELEPGTEHVLPIVADTLGRQDLEVFYATRRLSKILPLGLIEIHELPDEAAHDPIANLITFQPVRVAVKQASANELRQSRAPGNMRRAAREKDRVQHIKDEKIGDRLKINLTNQEYAIATIAGTVHYLPLRSRTAIVAARVLEMYGDPDHNQGQIYAGQIAPQVWDMMSLDERRMFAEKESVITSKTGSNLLSKCVKDVSSNLLRELGLRQSYSGAVIVTQPADMVQVSYHAQPLAAQKISQMPGILPNDLRIKEPNWKYLKSGVTQDGAQISRALAALYGQGKPLAAEECKVVLRHLLTVPGKRAIQNIAKASGKRGTYAQSLQQVHIRLARAMGPAQYRRTVRSLMMQRFDVAGAAGIPRPTQDVPPEKGWYVGPIHADGWQ